ncbi:hypothetical protein AQUCO_03400004v1 [Aquilegia coerulea]|uniref:Uncharacterized protein n=1 Tax=Aquilegia coerulea TaxID=218851 RepID=A0A2G5CY16_AQUCA|nr:hypothetical protein AQUCO_03400004v1 [Aquilegia coerulea]
MGSSVPLVWFSKIGNLLNWCIYFPFWPHRTTKKKVNICWKFLIKCETSLFVQKLPVAVFINLMRLASSSSLLL